MLMLKVIMPFTCAGPFGQLRLLPLHVFCVCSRISEKYIRQLAQLCLQSPGRNIKVRCKNCDYIRYTAAAFKIKNYFPDISLSGIID